MFSTNKRLFAITSSMTRVRNASQWANIKMAPPDKILGLNEAFKADKFPQKQNLGVGAYRDDNGKPFVLQSVREAERRILSANMDHEYAGIAGVQSYIDSSLKFAYGKDSLALKEGRVAAIQSLSGTGACRVVGEFIARFFGKETKMYMPDPTWGNHIPIMRDAGLTPAKYRYFDPKTCRVDFTGLLTDVNAAPEGSVFMLHACAHNPTGCDPTRGQWDELSKAMLSKRHTVFFDCAYQGFASGDAEADAYSIRKFVSDGHLILLSQSFAKNFGLYGERVGTLSVVGASKEEADRLNSQLKTLVRPMYSNPPVYGARIVEVILNDPQLREMWSVECKAMADRIISMRTALRGALEGLGSKLSWGHVTDQIGMFCYTGLSVDQVLRIREEYHIYCTEDGRISMAGVTSKNVAYIAEAIHAVTK